MKRELKFYRWEFANRKIIATNKKTGQAIILDKIGFMSLARFILSVQDRMRLDDLKVMKSKINALKEKYKANKGKYANRTATSRGSRKQNDSQTPVVV